MVKISSQDDHGISMIHWDVVVIGAGAAGLMTCLELPEDLNVLLINRNTSKRSASRWAQGGMAAVIRSDDSVESHAKDTCVAGGDLCDGDAVRMLVEEAPQCVRRLQELGMEFDQKDGYLAATLESAHSYRRVLHVKDQTGRALVEVLNEHLERRPNFVQSRGTRVTQLWIENNFCYGVQVLDGPFLHWIQAKAVVLATGGGGHLFANTTNPTQAAGEGIALAWRAGAIIEDLEFVQFHPTALKLDGAPSFLLSEALRGEGAVLVDCLGESPVAHLKGLDLAPRDEVSRALVQSMRGAGSHYIGLDLKPIPQSIIQSHFPTILQRCREFGLDPLKDLIPVAPAAHYWMGGVATNLNSLTSVSNLYAVGEVACTGLHGANRLASNSLMECLVFARKMKSISLSSEPFRLQNRNLKNASSTPLCLNLDNGLTDQTLLKDIQRMRGICWKHAGVDRSAQGIKNARRKIRRFYSKVSNQPLIDFMDQQPYDKVNYLEESSRRNLNLLLDLRSRQITTSLLFEACLFRQESRGGHFRHDFPSSMPYWRCHSQQKIGELIGTRKVRR